MSARTGWPVPFLRKSVVYGLRVPLGWPKVSEAPRCECEPPSGYTAPERLATPGLEVVLRAKVLAVGGT